MKLSANDAGNDLPGAGRVLIVGLVTHTLQAPRKIPIVPSVTMNGWTRRPTTSRPFTNPQSNPTPQAIPKAEGIVTQAVASSGKFCSALAVHSAASAKIAPTEISMPPAMMTNVAPIAMMAYVAMGVATPPMRLSARKNSGRPMAASNPPSNKTTMTRPAS